MMPLLAEAIAQADKRKRPYPRNIAFIWGLRAVNPDLTSKFGFTYPSSGWAKASGPFTTTNNPCPPREGDGICAALTWGGMQSGSIKPATLLLVGWTAADVLAADETKVRVKRLWVRDVVDAHALIRAGADLTGADLTRANLTRANLTGADLTGANLTGAYLYGAKLTGAKLTGANLGGAKLTGANLGGANLPGAYLGGADLGGANLHGANLHRAYLSGAHLTGANLGGARNGQTALWPAGFDWAKAGVTP